MLQFVNINGIIDLTHLHFIYIFFLTVQSHQPVNIDATIFFSSLFTESGGKEEEDERVKTGEGRRVDT